MRTHSRKARTLLGLILLLALGCASATKRLEQGAELEQQGRYAEAAARYIQALRKDPGMPEARQRLAYVGAQAIAQYSADAARFRTLGSFQQAADLYRASDALVQEAASVGVPLALPPGYAELRRTSFDETIAQLLHEGRSAEARAAWAEALQDYEQVAVYEPKPRQEKDARDGRLRASVLWGEADLAAGHYRAAFEHAEAALVLCTGGAGLRDPRGGDTSGRAEPTWGQRAQSVRDEALELGTVHAAMTPMRTGSSCARQLPEGFLEALNDELEAEHWTHPPLFVAVLDPLVVRRELRRQGNAHTAPSLRDAMRLGRDLGADFVVSLEIDAFAATDADVVAERRTARTRAGADTTYTVLQGTRNMLMTATLAFVDVEHGREGQRRSVDLTESGRFTRARYDGDTRQLRIPESDRRLFDLHHEHEQDQEIQDRLIEKAALQLAGQVYNDLVQSVP